jgi:hypothetical protein
MNLRTIVRTLTAAALLAVTVVSVSAQQADAKPRGPRQTSGTIDRDTTCAFPGFAVSQPQHDWVFYAWGEEIVVGGNRYHCSSTGEWLRSSF